VTLDKGAMSSDPREHFLHRRHLLCGGGSLVFAAMMTSLPSHSHLAHSPRRGQYHQTSPGGIRGRRVYAVIGGFHLAPYAEDYVRQTIAALKELDVDYVIPLHCSGEVLYTESSPRHG
jgi:hypothetical protein